MGDTAPKTPLLSLVQGTRARARKARRRAEREVREGLQATNKAVSGFDRISGNALSGPGQWYDSLETEKLEHPYRQEPWFYASVRKIEDSVRAARARVARDPETDEPEILTEGPLAALFARPNPILSSREFFARAAHCLMDAGECLLVFTDKFGVPISDEKSPTAPIPTPRWVWPVKGGPQRIREVLNQETGLLEGWEVKTKDGPKFYASGTVTLLRFQHPEETYRGMSPGEPLYTTSSQLYGASRYSAALLENAGDPGGTIELPDRETGFDADEYERIVDEVDEQWNDPDRTGETRVLPPGATYKPNSMGPREMAFPQLFRLGHRIIGAATGTPVSMLGEGSSNFATFKGEERVFWSTAVIPLLDLIAWGLTDHFFSRVEGGEGLGLVWDLSRISALQGNLDEQITSAERLIGMGVPINQALKRVGIDLDEDIEGGDVPLIKAGMQRLEDVVSGAAASSAGGGVGGGVTPADDDGGDEEPGDEQAALTQGPTPNLEQGQRQEKNAAQAEFCETREEREAVWKAQDARIAPVEGKLERAARRIFRQAGRAQKARLKALAAQGKLPEESARIYDGAPVRVSPESLILLREAAEFDQKWIARKPGRLACGCQTSDPGNEPGPEVRKWLKGRHGRTRREWRRMVDLAYLARTELSEADLDALVIALQADYAEALGAEIEGASLEAWTRASAAIADEIGPSFQLPSDPDIAKILRDKAINVAEGSTSSLARQLRSAFVRTLSESSALGALQDVVKAELDNLTETSERVFRSTRARARTIARTEIRQASNMARARRIGEAADQGLIDGRRWLTAIPASVAPPESRGGTVRDTHWQLDGEKAPIGQPWTTSSGATLRHPSDPLGPAAEIVNCRCAETVVFSEGVVPTSEE